MNPVAQQVLMVLGGLAAMVVVAILAALAWERFTTLVDSFMLRWVTRVEQNAIRRLGAHLLSQAYWLSEHPEAKALAETLGETLVRTADFDMPQLRGDFKRQLRSNQDEGLKVLDQVTRGATK